MGNFSVNHYTRLSPAADGVEVHYVLDFAEIPTFELLRAWDIDRNAPTAVLLAKARAQALLWGENLAIGSDRRLLRPRLQRVTAAIADGAGNLPILRVDTWWLARSGGGHIDYEDRNYSERAGWKEIVVAAGRGAAVQRASQDDIERSHALTAYPPDPTVAPPQDLRASFDWTLAAPVTAPRRPVIARIPQPASRPAPASPAAIQKAPPAGAVVRGDRLSRLLHGPISPAVILIAIGLAFLLGAAHAFTPGHGKTMVAAYLVGSRGTMRHAAILGATVTFTHTITVFLLGVITLFFFRYLAPERVTEALGVISGLAIVATGGCMLLKRLRKTHAHHHHHHHEHHHHDHEHHHHDHDHHHHHGPHAHTHTIEGDITLGSLLALGASGGLVPCESALVLLLSAIALGRVGFGLMLLTAFSLGLAVVLVALGMMVLYARHLLPERARNSGSGIFRWGPVASAAAVMIVGLLMTGVSLGLLKPGWLLG